MLNLEIQFNSEIIKKVKAQNFQVDQLGSILFILFALYENRLDLLDEFDDYNKARRAILMYKELEVRDLIAEDLAASKGEATYNLTKSGMEFVESLKAEFSKTQSNVTSVDIAVSGVDTLKDVINADDVEGWIDEWVDLFPRGVKSGGRLVRSDRQSCLRKMKVFLREYDYDRDTILNATRKYVESKANDGYNYMKCAVYFIYRADTSRVDKVSDLATWCDQYKHDEGEGKNHSENNLEFMA